MLTIVGYSINATIVVFDRIRESLHNRRAGTTLAELVNDSVSATLTRSIFTSLTTFFMVLTLYIFGVASVKEFALPLMIGIIAGCWSSVCIAGPLWHLLHGKTDQAAPSEKGTGSGGDSNPQPKKKQGSSNLSKKERKRLKQKEIEERNKAKTVI